MDFKASLRTAFTVGLDSLAAFYRVIIEYPVFFAVISFFALQGILLLLAFLRDKVLDCLFKWAEKHEQELAEKTATENEPSTKQAKEPAKLDVKKLEPKPTP
jgi:hypothetical protein